MADRKQEIIEAGIEIFATKGYYNTHISDIVEAVGIAKGTFYLYFNSKKDLFITLIKRFETIFSALFDSEMLNYADQDLKSVFIQILKKVFNLYKNNENLSIIILREAVAVNHKFSHEFRAMEAKRLQRLKNLYQFLVAGNYLSSEIDFDYFACVFLGIMESVVMRRLLLTDKSFDVEEAAAKISCYLEKAVKK